MPRTRRRTTDDVVRSDSFGFRVWLGQPGAMRAAHQHTDIELNFVLRGRMRYFLAGRFQEVPAGRLAGMWAGLPHRLVAVDEPTECAWITLPLAWFLSWGLPEPFTQRMLGGELLLEPDTERAAEDRRLHERWAQDFASRDPERLKIVLLETEARVRRLALALSVLRRKRAGGPGKGEGAAVERISDFIAKHYQDELSVEDIARAAGLHPNYAMTLFKRSCGMSIWEYLTRLRVSHAQRLLMTSDAKVLEVALDSGFGSSSRFYETFLRVVGKTPKAYRAGMREDARR